MPHNVKNWKIEHDIRERLSELRVDVVPLAHLSSSTALLKQCRPILIYVFIRVRQPCLAWFGTTSQLGAKRLLSQKSIRTAYDYVAFLQVPAGVDYDSEFGKTVEYNTMSIAERLWPWCFLENRRRDQYFYDTSSKLVQHLAMLVVDAVEPLVENKIKLRCLNQIFDCPTHSIIDPREITVGYLVKHKHGATILRDSAIFQEPFFWDLRRSTSDVKLTLDQNALLKKGILYKPGFALFRYPLLVRIPYRLSSIDKARHFIAGNSSVLPSIVPL